MPASCSVTEGRGHGTGHAEKDVFFLGGPGEGQERQSQCTSALSMTRVGTLQPLGLSRKVPGRVAHVQARGAPSPRKSEPGPAGLRAREGCGAAFLRNPWGGGRLQRGRGAASGPPGAACRPLVKFSGPTRVGRGRAHAARGSAGKHVPLRPRGKTPLRPGAGAPFRTFPKLAATSPAGPWQPGDRAFPCGTVHVASLLSPGRVVSSVGKSDGGSGSSGAGVTFPSRPGLACAGVPFRSVPDRTCGRCECVVFSWGW